MRPERADVNGVSQINNVIVNIAPFTIPSTVIARAVAGFAFDNILRRFLPILTQICFFTG